jgi:hypothetical protein
MNQSLKDYNSHVETIKKLTIDTYGEELTGFCYANFLPKISQGLILLHLMNPEKALPDMEMVLFSLVKESSKVPFDLLEQHLLTTGVISKILDEALELTLNAGFGDIEF